MKISRVYNGVNEAPGLILTWWLSWYAGGELETGSLVIGM